MQACSCTYISNLKVCDKIRVLSVSLHLTVLSRPRQSKNNEQSWSSSVGILDVVVRISKHLTWICSFAYQEGFVTKYLAVNSWDFVMPCCVNINRYSNNRVFSIFTHSVL